MLSHIEIDWSDLSCVHFGVFVGLGSGGFPKSHLVLQEDQEICSIPVPTPYDTPFPPLVSRREKSPEWPNKENSRSRDFLHTTEG